MNRRLPILVLATLGLLAATLSPATAERAPATAVPTTQSPVTATPTARKAWTPRPATYDQVAQKDVPIRMSDGTVLSADVFRPGHGSTPAKGRFPVILSITPYNKALPGTNFAMPSLVQRGYVQVIADVRGTGSSEGRWVPFQRREQLDAVEVSRWIDRQPWSNHRLGIYGVSYGAISALLAAETGAEYGGLPGLKALFPVVPSGDNYRDVFTQGGSIDAGFIPAWLGLVTGAGLLPMTPDPQRLGRVMVDHLEGALAFQASQGVGALTGGELAYDGPYFRQSSTLERIDKVRVPTFVAGGLYDLFQRSEPRIFSALQENGVPSKLVFGPWTHVEGSMGSGLPADGVDTLNNYALRWFDRYLMGRPDPSLNRDVPPVSYYQIGGPGYLKATSWPPAGTSYHAVRLGGAATPNPGKPGTLSRSSSGGPDALPYVPVTGMCSASTAQWTLAPIETVPLCGGDERIADLGGLSYEMPVKRDLALAGDFSVHLNVSSTAPDGVLTVRVEDVAPDGSIKRVSAGSQVLSLRALDNRRTVREDGLITQPWHPMTKVSQRDMPAGKPVPVDIEIFPSAALVKAGHKLRITIQAADFPVHSPGTPTLTDSLGNLPSGLKIWHDAKHPSWLVFPVTGSFAAPRSVPVDASPSGVPSAPFGTAGGSGFLGAAALPFSPAAADPAAVAEATAALTRLQGGTTTPSALDWTALLGLP
ncbi:MAG TPA: CocE/NonD family hydrolase [Marmoricola sp.]|nr:CocE/NonD family hydrolase [Marmoricola sp.]